LSLDIIENKNLIFACNSGVTKTVKHLNYNLNKTWFHQNCKGSVYSTICSQKYTQKLFYGCYSNNLHVVDLRSLKHELKLKTDQCGGISGIILINKEKQAFLGGSGGRIVLVCLQRREILFNVKVKASVYAIDIGPSKLVIGGTGKEFYFIELNELKSIVGNYEI
jgi:hypothetical protein